MKTTNKALWIAIVVVIAQLLIFCTSCTNDDSSNCDAEKQSITEKYEKQIQYVKDHPFAGTIDYRQITLLQQERDRKLDEACK